jgi:predicted DNA-binding transcriptional regulator AlpA
MAIKSERLSQQASSCAIQAATLLQSNLTTNADRLKVPSQTELFTTPEAAAYTKIAVPTLERYRLTGEGPMFAKLGGCVRYRRCDLDAWIESRLVRSTSQTP